MEINDIRRRDMYLKEPIRILCVFTRIDLGGAEIMCMNLYRNIDRGRV